MRGASVALLPHSCSERQPIGYARGARYDPGECERKCATHPDCSFFSNSSSKIKPCVLLYSCIPIAPRSQAIDGMSSWAMNASVLPSLAQRSERVLPDLDDYDEPAFSSACIYTGSKSSNCKRQRCTCSHRYAPRCRGHNASTAKPSTAMAMREVRWASRVQPALVAPNATAPREALFWIHVPKCGSSFINLLLLLCDGFPRCARMEPLDTLTDFYNVYPPWRYCTPTFPNRSAWVDRGHDGMDSSLLARGRSGIIMLRQPESRLLSGYWQHPGRGAPPGPGMHFWREAGAPHSHANGTRALHVSELEYAKALQGCAVRMLTRSGPLACAKPPLPTDAEVALAVWRLRNHFAFVGLTERWAESIVRPPLLPRGGKGGGAQARGAATIPQTTREPMTSN